MFASLFNSTAQNNLTFMADPSSWSGSNPIGSKERSLAFYAKPLSASGLVYYSLSRLAMAAELYALMIIGSPFFSEETRQPFFSDKAEDVCPPCYKNFERSILTARSIRDATFDFADQMGQPELRKRAESKLPEFMESYGIKGVAFTKATFCLIGDKKAIRECRIINYVGNGINHHHAASPYFAMGCAALTSLYLVNYWSKRESVEATLTASLKAKYQDVATLLKKQYENPELKDASYESAKKIIANSGKFYKDIAALGLPSLADVEKQQALIAPVIDQAIAIIRAFQKA